MRRIALLTFALTCAISVAAQNNPKECKKNCDCSHWPWTSKCKNCCGISSGTVVSDRSGELKLQTEDGSFKTFKLNSQTKINGELRRGERSKVFYKISVNDTLGITENVAATVTTDKRNEPVSEHKKE